MTPKALTEAQHKVLDKLDQIHVELRQSSFTRDIAARLDDVIAEVEVAMREANR
jgi:hypothetical protein